MQPTRIILLGANGAGKSTLGRELARVLGTAHFDVEDYYFCSSEIPYTVLRSESERVEMLRSDMRKHGSYVVSGDVSGWSDAFLSMFDLAVFLDAPTDIRLSRIEQRESKRWGDRIIKGGDMYESQRQFRAHAVSRDIAKLQQSATAYRCPLVHVDGTVDYRETAVNIAARFHDDNNRTVYCRNESVSLVEQLPIDLYASWLDWQDSDTQKGYNGFYNQNYEEFLSKPNLARFTAMIMGDTAIVGWVGISSPDQEPDLAIRIFAPYRRSGCGSSAFALATEYALDCLEIEELHAGAYEDNIGSLKMLKKCGYVPFPEGNAPEKHYLTGEDIVQYDFVRERTAMNKLTLADILVRDYGLDVFALTEATRGYYGETWCAETSSGKRFVKLVKSAEHRKRYERSFAVMNFLNARGVTTISRPIATVGGEWFTELDGSTLGVFEWIDGVNVQDERTKIAEYGILASVYAASEPGLDIPTEDFGTDVYELFLSQCEQLATEPQSEVSIALLRLFNDKRDVIQHRAERLSRFSELCKPDRSNFYITHGDAGGNIITDGEQFSLVDWDSPVYAQPERDAWFCLHWDWAQTAFRDALASHGIDYLLRPERLAYYCYKFFFGYLTLYLESYFDGSVCSEKIVREIAEYFGCWIEDNIRFADTIEL